MRSCGHPYIRRFPSRSLFGSVPRRRRSGWVAANSGCNAGDAALALSEMIHGAKPSAQRHLGRRENRCGDHGCLPSTGATATKRLSKVLRVPTTSPPMAITTAPTPGAGSPPPLPSSPTLHSPRRRTNRTGPETVGSGRPIYLKKAGWHECGRRLTPSVSARE